MAQRLLNRLFQDTELGNIIRENEPLLIEVLYEDAELGNVIRDSEPLLIEVLNEERELVIVDNNTREVRNADIEQAFTIVADTADISDCISIIGDQDICGSPETFGDDENSEHFSEEHGNVDKQFGFCMYCIKYEPVQAHDQLKRGDCIRFPKKWGLYYHHAIVKEVQGGSTSSCCTLTLIHLQKIGPPILTRVIEETKTYDVREDIVEKVIYKSNPFSPVEIIRRAEEYAAKNETPHVYNLFRNNCEHLSNQFAQGVKISHQVCSKLEQLTSGCLRILNVLCRIGSKIMRLRGIASLVSIVSLTDIIRSIIQLKKFFRDNIVCFCCYGKEYKKLKRALVLGVISLAVSIINHFNWGTLTFNLIITIALPFVVPLVYTHAMPLIRPAFLIPKQKLSIKNIPRAGDIITFDYYNLPHEGVVSNIHGIGSDMTRLKATIIHFPWPGLFKTFTVTEETISFSQTDDVSVLNFEGTHHFPASVVVWKARKELGKQNHSSFTYRSSHLSRYCKVSYFLLL
jgi:hypothetical protein